jgi:hypothetical protein
MRDSKLRVLPFEWDAFLDAYSGHTQRAQVEQHNQRVRLLFSYLVDINVKTLVIEEEYTDGDYLDDYANYYVRSDADHPRRCKRLHFFSGVHEEGAFLEELLRPDGPSDALKSAYRGFSVARPLPDAVVGRTVVATYDPVGSEGERSYPATHTYTAHLMGSPFTLESLAFQEQDTVLAACATVALWSAFHQTAHLFHTPRQSPARITHLASVEGLRARALPSRGLTLTQTCIAIKAVGLEPEVFECGPKTPVLSIIYAYLNAGLPVVLFVDIEKVGVHAITINGYQALTSRLHERETAGYAKPDIGGKGLRIKKLYGHDDQICPFARLEVCIATDVGEQVKTKDSQVYFEGSWEMDEGGEKRPRRITPRSIIVPLYHKIRLDYHDIDRLVVTFTHGILMRVFENLDGVEWNIRLAPSSAWKRELRRGPAATATKQDMLAWQLPRFIWVATLQPIGADGAPIVELLFDATGIRRSHPLLEVLYFEDDIRERIYEIARTASAEDFPAGRRLFLFLQDQIGRTGKNTPSAQQPEVPEAANPEESGSSTGVPAASNQGTPSTE